MNPPPFVYNNIILPAPPRNSSDSERSSFSSASALSDNYTKSPEPDVKVVTQNAVEIKSTSIINKKIIIIVSVLLVLLLVTAIIVGVTVPLTLGKGTTATSIVTTSMQTVRSSTTLKK